MRPSDGAAMPALDFGKAAAFAGRLMEQMSGALAGAMCVLGERLGLFRVLAAEGPLSCEELAKRAGIDPRYAKGWLEALTCAGLIEYSPEGARYSLPVENAAVVALEGGPMYMGGAFRQLPALLSQLDRLTEAFKSGEGLPQSTYPDEMWEGMELISARWFDHMLVPMWIPAIPDLKERLESGIQVADVGCGSGRALINLASAFPRSRFVGYDCFETAVARARARAAERGVADRVHFEQKDALGGLGAEYDLITAFDVVHDFIDPLRGLRTLREALSPGGCCLMLEVSRQEGIEDNLGPVGTILHSTSVLYGIPVSLANGGDGSGTTGLTPSALKSLVQAAGFTSCQQVPILDPFNVLFDLRV